MNSQKLMVGLVLGVLIVVLAIVLKGLQKEELSSVAPPAPSGSTKTTDLQPPRPSGNVDDAVGAMLLEAQAEDAIFEQETGDAALLGSDSRALSEFGGAYAETEF